MGVRCWDYCDSYCAALATPILGVEKRPPKRGPPSGPISVIFFEIWAGEAGYRTMSVVRLVALDVESTITGEKRKTGVFQNARTSTSATGEAPFTGPGLGIVFDPQNGAR